MKIKKLKGIDKMIDTSDLIKRQELFWEKLKKEQCMDKDSVWYGGFNFAYQHSETKILVEGLPLYCDKRSSYYRNEELLKRIKLNSEFVLRYQHKSGLISLLDCNIQSPPDTAFMVNLLAICHFYIEEADIPELEEVDKNILTFLERTQNALITGGFHTPNHRWVISCALSFLYLIFKREDLKARAKQYLAEGIDINESGEWTERSNAIYNAVSDLFMYHIGKNFDVPKALDAVRKNLDMMKYLLHPNNYIVTEYSTRQDKGKIAHMDFRYTIVYQLMSAEDNNAEYAYMAEQAIKEAQSFGEILLYSGIYKDEMNAPIKAEPISDKYIKMINEGAVTIVPKAKSTFGDSVLRYRNGDLSITIMAGQPDFLFFQYGDARIFGMRFVPGWFGLGGISFPTIEKISDNKYRMATPVKGKYWQVMQSERVSEYNGNFSIMPNDEREDINKVEFFAECIISLFDDGIDIELTAEGFDFLFTQLVCMFDEDGCLQGEDIAEMNKWVTRQNSGKSVYTCGGFSIELAGIGNEHDIDVVRGDVLNKEAQNLVFNFVAPKKKKISIRCK